MKVFKLHIPIKIFLAIVILFCISSAKCQSSKSISNKDRYRIAEAIRINNKYGDAIWPGISKTPFAIILVTDSEEYLINHPKPSDDFHFLNYNTLLKTNIYVRQRIFPKELLATFPAVNGVNCVVIGTAENTQKGSADWIITLLHEHFHQFEYTYPDYYQQVTALNLAKGDNTGGWMLNYAFPYNSVPVEQQFSVYKKALLNAVKSINSSHFKEKFKIYDMERQKFKDLLSPDDYRYFSFQVWQEGIARYTEYKFLMQLHNDPPSDYFIALQDSLSLSSYMDVFYKGQLHKLETEKLSSEKRSNFYAVGFAEGLLLDKINPAWRKNFLTDKFYIEHYFTKQ
ncbi:MAG: hypothetical protein ACJ748_06315 [Flavisolibacter sp.]